MIQLQCLTKGRETRDWSAVGPGLKRGFHAEPASKLYSDTNLSYILLIDSFVNIKQIFGSDFLLLRLSQSHPSVA